MVLYLASWMSFIHDRSPLAAMRGRVRHDNARGKKKRIDEALLHTIRSRNPCLSSPPNCDIRSSLRSRQTKTFQVKNPKLRIGLCRSKERVLQGEVLSSLIFILYMSEFRNKDIVGIDLYNFKNLLVLLYAEDLVFAMVKTDFGAQAASRGTTQNRIEARSWACNSIRLLRFYVIFITKITILGWKIQKSQLRLNRSIRNRFIL